MEQKVDKAMYDTSKALNDLLEIYNSKYDCQQIDDIISLLNQAYREMIRYKYNV